MMNPCDGMRRNGTGPALRCVLSVLFVWLSGRSLAAPAERALRCVFPLDGRWQIAEGTLTNPPTAFDHTVPVPGLVDMADPPFAEPGPKVAERSQASQKDPRRDAFWYRRTFSVTGSVPASASLKIGKAMFGARVFLNGKLLGDHAPCFTPGIFGVRDALKEGENELVVRVGADRDAVSAAVPSGFDFEKTRYLPGLFDSVELVLSGEPHIDNVQIVPDVAKRQAKIRVYANGTGDAAIEVREWKSGRNVGEAAGPLVGAETDFAVAVADCKLWSPETPFLYEAVVRTAGDEFKVRFGMREFKFDPATGRATLNGKPYFMRGSNITLYRFFEDGERGGLPWDEKWVRLLHRRVKDMHWNSLRYCIGFPPEIWYAIADEEGVLIDDEFPIWFGNDIPPGITADELAAEYSEWMRERWNHPCVAVWDACNETKSPRIGEAIKRVRALDLSARPWDNGYSAPQEPGDMLESHPYHFYNSGYKLANLATEDPVPQGNQTRNDGSHAVVINEYGWLWLNRDGTPTTLTQAVYKNLLGESSTEEQRRHLYARYTAAETEFWRCHRTAAAVLHFTALGYTRPDGQTSDHWADVKSLTWEPEFYRYVRDAFAPVGVMIDAWAEAYEAGTPRDFPVVLVNDLESPWQGKVVFRLLRGGKSVWEQERPVGLAGFATAREVFRAAVPKAPGAYQAEAVLVGTPAGDVRSLRDFSVLSAEEIEARRNLGEGCLVRASSAVTADGKAYRAEYAVDGRGDTRWSSEFSDPQWLALDLGRPHTVTRVSLSWEAAFARAYAVQVSMDGENWKTVYATDEGNGGFETIRFAPVGARWVRIHGTRRGTSYGYSLWEVGVYR